MKTAILKTTYSLTKTTDKTTDWVFDVPIYHHRLANTFPEAVPATSNIRLKLNVCCGISYKGPTDIVFYNKKIY